VPSAALEAFSDADESALVHQSDRTSMSAGEKPMHDGHGTRAQGDDAREPAMRKASMARVSSRALPRPDSVTVVIEQRPRSDAVVAYEAWLKRIVPVAERFPGHRGVHIIRPGDSGGAYTIALRFDSLLHAEDWFQSDARHELLEEAAPLLVDPESRRTLTGLEFWFDAPSGAKPVRRYKQFLLTLLAIFPLTMAVPAFVAWSAGVVPVLQNYVVAHFTAAVIVVALMAYVVMPRLTRWAAAWLYR
jgi:antibiotic biosynthesis monooxygenase (ABM) superfamily enzyme